MKLKLLFILLLLTLAPAFAWNSYSNSYSNSFYSGISGGGRLYEKFSLNVSSFLVCAPLMQNSKLFAAENNIVTAYSPVGEQLWNFTKNGISCPVIYDNKLIVGSEDKLSALTLDGAIIWETGTERIVSLTAYDGIVVAASASQLSAYLASNGSQLWAKNLANCSYPAIMAGNVVAGCASKLYSISLLDGSAIFAAQADSNIVNPVMIVNDTIIVSQASGLYQYDNTGRLLGKNYYFLLSKAVNTNAASSGGAIYSCAENGLYVSRYDGFFYIYNQLPLYANCYSPVLLDFDNDSSAELFFLKTGSVVAVNSEGGELLKIPFAAASHISSGDFDNDYVAEIAIASNTTIKVYDTALPELDVKLSITESGVIAEFYNKGVEPANTTFLFTTPHESVNGSLFLYGRTSKTELLNWQPRTAGTYDATIYLCNAVDSNCTLDTLRLSAVSVSSSDFGVINRNTYYHFATNFSTPLKSQDVNNNAMNETLVDAGLGYYYYFDNGMLGEVGDLYASVSAFPSSILDNETLYVSGTIVNAADYPLFNASISLYVNGERRETRSLNLNPLSNTAFTFAVSGLPSPYAAISIMTDTDNDIYEKNEDNNLYSKNIEVFPSKIHSVSITADYSSFSSENQDIKIVVKNSGDYDETLSISINGEPYGEIICQSRNVTTYSISFNYAPGVYDINLSVSNNYSSYNDFFTLNTLSGGSVFASVSDTTLSTNTNLITSMLTLSSADSDVAYWFFVIVLLLIASAAAYLATYKLFYEQCEAIAVTNFVIFFCVALLFKPENMAVILFEEIILLGAMIAVQKLRR